MVTIITRILPATDTKPTRIQARFGDVGWGPKRSTVSYLYELTSAENHFNAARKLWSEWSGTLDANYVGAGDNHRFAERVHLLKAFPGKVHPLTGNRGGEVIFSDILFSDIPDRS
jgi:hypothetical protein